MNREFWNIFSVSSRGFFGWIPVGIVPSPIGYSFIIQTSVYCISVSSIPTNTNTTFQHSRKFKGVRKFILEKPSYMFVYAPHNSTEFKHNSIMLKDLIKCDISLNNKLNMIIKYNEQKSFSSNK
jgi:hypothetical protein